jgi:diacylglycerol O-acyltransferase
MTPESPTIPAPKWEPQPAPSKQRLLRDSLIERVTKPTEVIRSVRAGLRAPRQAFEEAVTVGKGVLSFGKAVQHVAPKTSLYGHIGRQRRFEVVRTRLDEVKAVKARHGCTVNDVVLALVAGGLRELLLSRGDDIDGLRMRAAVPVSVRDETERMTYGNKVAAMFAELPVGEADPVSRLRSVQAEMAVVKESKEAVGAEALMQLADFAPPTILGLAGRALANQWTINLTVTNVPGPQFPLYFLGGEMLEAFPYVPLVGTTTVGVAVLSYNGQLNFGLVGDWDAVPDLAVVAEGIEKSLSQLAS